MAIANPEQSTDYCLTGESNARLEYQTPDREVLEADYEWSGITTAILPVRYLNTETLGTFIETVVIAPGTSVQTIATLTLNKYYTFIVTGLITLSGTTSADGCFFIDSGNSTTEPSDRLTTDDEQFTSMFFNAAEQGTVEYDGVTHEYSVGYIGNDATVTFTLAAGGTGSLDIDIFETDYRLLVTNESDGTTVIFDETRQQPYLNINIACGGDCPTRTSFSCECTGLRSCYFDNDAGTIEKIFEGTKTP